MKNRNDPEKKIERKNLQALTEHFRIAEIHERNGI